MMSLGVYTRSFAWRMTRHLYLSETPAKQHGLLLIGWCMLLSTSLTTKLKVNLSRKDKPYPHYTKNRVSPRVSMKELGYTDMKISKASMNILKQTARYLILK